MAGGLVLTSGCAAVSNINVKQASNFNSADYKTIAIEVTSKDTDFQEWQKIQLIEFVYERLNKSGRFEKVRIDSVDVNHKTDLKLSVTIDLVVGSAVGKLQSIETSVALINSTNGNVLANAAIDAHGRWPFFGGKVNRAIDQLSNAIVDFAVNDGKPKAEELK